MGAAAFLMVEFLGVPYQTIILAADRPRVHAFLWRLLPGAFRGQEARHARTDSRAELPAIGAVLKRDWPTSIPLLVLLIVLFSGFTPYLAAFWGITACVVVGLTRRNPAVAVAFLSPSWQLSKPDQLTEWLGTGLVIGSQPRSVRSGDVMSDDDGKARARRYRRRLRARRQIRDQRRRGGGDGRHHRRHRHADGRRIQVSGIVTNAASGGWHICSTAMLAASSTVQWSGAVLHADHDRHRLHPARHRRADDGDLHHHGHGRAACPRA